MKRVWTFSASRGLSLLSSSFCLAIRRNPPLTLPHGRSKRTMISLVTKQSWPIWKSEKPKPKPTQETEDERQARYAREADEMKLKWDARWALDIDERHGVEEWWVDLWHLFFAEFVSESCRILATDPNLTPRLANLHQFLCQIHTNSMTDLFSLGYFTRPYPSDTESMVRLPMAGWPWQAPGGEAIRTEASSLGTKRAGTCPVGPERSGGRVVRKVGDSWIFCWMICELCFAKLT